MDTKIENIIDFKLRGFYPNYNYYKFLIDNKGSFPVHKIGEGYRNSIVEYFTGSGKIYELEIDFEDAVFLLNNDKNISNKYLEHILRAKNEDKQIAEQLQLQKTEFYLKKLNCYNSVQLTENEYVIPSSSLNEYDIDHISHKGAMLLKLSQKAYPVPDFTIISAKAFNLPTVEKSKIIHQAIENLENMTCEKLGSYDSPLVFAMRCAMPIYIPGLMPTYLNVGVTQQTFVALKNIYGYHVASKIYLNNLRTIFFLLFPHQAKPSISDRGQYYSIEQLNRKIGFYHEQIRLTDPLLLEDPYHQINFFFKQAEIFFDENELLINTFLKNKQAWPSFILQKMVWTIRDQDSYPGVLYSRNSYTGEGRQIESVRNIFGEDIMSGSVNAEYTEFHKPDEIKEKFPAIFHFLPKLEKLEKEIHSPATIEFATETFDRKSLFAVLQLNKSEMTGRAILLAAIEMYKEKLIKAPDIIDLIQTYHLKQVFSPTIDEKELDRQKLFCNGFAILPRSAISVKIYFSAEKALQAKKKGERVGFCKEEFVPSDTIVMSEVDAIISLNPAAIHVVTACMRYGVQAFLNLEKQGVQLKSKQLINKDNSLINEGDWITLNSTTKSIYLGKAKMRPARLQQFIDGKKVDLENGKEVVFKKLAKAYQKYQEIIEELKQGEIAGFNELIKILRNEKDKNQARFIINEWFKKNEQEYTEQILKCELGSHQEQQGIFLLLNLENKVNFFKEIIPICIQRNLQGYTAGSFMLGRFLTIMLPIAFWKNFIKSEILFLLNESVLFDKYIHILYEVGERNISKARHKILQEGLQEINLKTSNTKNFTSLKLTFKKWDKLSKNVSFNFDIETTKLIEELKLPFGRLYDYTKPWSLSKLQKICDEEKIQLPDENQI